MKIENITLIKYRIINKDELSVELFNDFIRHQVVTKCWRKKILNDNKGCAFY